MKARLLDILISNQQEQQVKRQATTVDYFSLFCESSAGVLQACSNWSTFGVKRNSKFLTIQLLFYKKRMLPQVPVL